MYRSVPPPGVSGSLKNDEENTKEMPAVVSLSVPDNISRNQWERFQKLKARRIDLGSKGSVQRKKALRNKALHAVCDDFSESDKEILAKEGLTLPKSSSCRKRKTLSKSLDYSSSGSVCSSKTIEKWQEVKKYLDPNPQLKGLDEGRLCEKSILEKTLDEAVERGELEEAVSLSDEMANREFATKISTAFDCLDYVKRKKLKEEKKKSRKPTKLKWSFEQKKRWETKGNM